LLAALHREPLPEALPLTPQLTYTIPVFDTDALLTEASLMLDWYLPDRGAEPTSNLRAEFDVMWRDR
jgi:aminoglycoside/choline kinase family phosphotransferase